ncbi:sporulation protein YunB [Clostridium sp. ZC22-4]|uniref:Sporulation protein YunB n=1 Tax=Clostridium brassicae TaxID=2999072 RepID=A0ABT4D8I1_9CLOT|nr:sporulation protein YunB [Clostridium brassicae]
MKYRKVKILGIVLLIIISVSILLYIFNKTLTPSITEIADTEAKAMAIEIINKCIVDEYVKNFNYDDIIKYEKDSEGNIILLKADTLKMNMIACEVALKASKQLKEVGEKGISLPFSYVFKNNIISSIGPNINIKINPVGYVEAKYISVFESAGINQTRHKIYVRVNTKVKVMLALSSNIVEINNEVPIAETIIVGKVPDTALQFDDKGVKIPSN